MTSASLTAQLENHGLDPAERTAKAALYESVLTTIAGVSSKEPDSILWIPGRLEVFGTHTDYAGGRTLIAAVPRGFAFAAAARPGGEIHITDARHGDRVTIRQSDSASSFAGWRRYCAVVVERLVRNFPGAALGAEVVFASDLPRASGMSSSSALIVGLATVLGRIAGLHRRPEWKAAIRTRLDEAAYYACLESGMMFGALDGDNGVGTHGGSEDHVAMLCARAGHLAAYQFVPARELDRVEVPDGWSVVVMSSGVASEKGGAAQAGYNALASSAAVLLGLWNQAEAPAASLGAALGSRPDALARLEAMVRAAAVPGWNESALERRLRHFVREDARVPVAVAALRHADRAQFGALTLESQRDAETLLGNQVPATTRLASLARECGAFAARSFGAGFGGSVWALVDRDDAPAFARRWHAAYREEQPEANAVAFIAPPGPPLTELG